MNPTEQRALLAIALMAAFADGEKSEAEHAELRRIADTLGTQAAGLNLPALVQDVLLGRLTVADAATALSQPNHRQLAYEMAVCVCDADGSTSPAERKFLDRLRAALQHGGSTAPDTGFAARVDELAATIDAGPPMGVAPAGPVAGAGALSPEARAALERSILNQAILCGALELLPQSWATLAIVPLQVRMVYAVGAAHGVQLDQGHVKEFIATVGVGMASQVVEQFGRKLLGGLLGSVAGGLGRGLGRAGAGVAMSFATTYALGHVALRYYGGGRQMSTALLRRTYDEVLGGARTLQAQVLPQIEQRARTLDAASVMQMARQPPA
jgi:tellurite resistance protein/uncharacterized protein (DUF697 family)